MEKFFFPWFLECFQFDTSIIWCASSLNDKNRPIVVQVCYNIEKQYPDNFLYLFAFKEYVGGTLHPEDFELFKQGKIKGGVNTEIVYENGIELTIDDIPNIYKLLG